MHKIFNKIAFWILSLLIILSFPADTYAGKDSMHNFKNDAQYTPGQFVDVDESQWYGANKQQSIMLAYELGLMKGNEGHFSPHGEVTLVEAITMAARVAAIYKGEEELLVQGQPWYKVYVDYCMEKGIIRFNDFLDYSQPATRAQLAYIFANALPEKEFKKINQVEFLPDVLAQSMHGKEIFLLYNSGVIGGNDEFGTFSPNASISRAEAAAIISREALVNNRLTGLAFAKVDANQVLQSKNAEAKVMMDDLWDYYYSPGMDVNSNHQLDSLLYYATANRIPTFNAKIASVVFPSLGNYIPDGLETYAWSYFPGAYYYTTLTFDYSVYGEVKALMQSDMAWDYASHDAKNRYDYLYVLLDEIGIADQSPRDKVTLIHDYMVKNYKYDSGCTKYSFTDLVDSNSGVCQAYAQMFYLLSNMSGVETQYLTGITSNASNTGTEGHAWNRVAIDGYWYYVDTTWDDPTPDKGPNAAVVANYLLISKTQMDKDHTLQQIDGKAVGK